MGLFFIRNKKALRGSVLIAIDMKELRKFYFTEPKV